MATKIGKIAGNVIMILIFIIGIYTFFGILLGGGTTETGEVEYNDSAVSLGLNTSIYVIIIGIILALVFGIIRLILDFKKNAKIVLSIAIFAVLALIVYFTATDALPAKTFNFLLDNGAEEGEIATTAQRVDFGLKLTVTLVTIATASIVIGWVVTMAKRLR